jgi:DNA-binding transcriptional LysR family regulator
MAEGLVDMILSNVPVRPPLHEEILGRPGYAIVARKDHPTLGRRFTLAAFRKARHLLVRPVGAGVKHGEAVEKALRKLDVQVAIQVGHFFPVGAIVGQSDLVAIVPWGIAKTLEGAFPLRIHRPPMALPPTHLSLAWHERQHRDPGNRWFRELFIREMHALYEQASYRPAR